MFLSFRHMSGTYTMHPSQSWHIVRSFMKPYHRKIILQTCTRTSAKEKYFLLVSWIFLAIWLRQPSHRPCTGAQVPPWGLHELSVAQDECAASQDLILTNRQKSEKWSEDSDFSYFILGLRTWRKSNIIQIPLGVWNCFKMDYASIWSELSTCKICKGTEKKF